MSHLDADFAKIVGYLGISRETEAIIVATSGQSKPETVGVETDGKFLHIIIHLFRQVLLRN